MSINYYNMPEITQNSAFERKVKAYAQYIKETPIASVDAVTPAESRMIALCAVGSAYNSAAQECKDRNEIDRLAQRYNMVLDAHNITEEEVMNSI
jgi:hypothetical protein